ncbi:hypothetical protein M011DRAFT_525099 [Sporormia fimetaria CBS 119925]|uniref:Phosphotransferase n=1 Tax=Sporormia fimetaria CBS 119925 TaxID=1340428 RepID=A0A6A6VHA2_9PLEO|nr:hypothetical protein M011DRAFT_525099 [Sporormia fimetaria CBS 119925]
MWSGFITTKTLPITANGVDPKRAQLSTKTRCAANIENTENTRSAPQHRQHLLSSLRPAHHLLSLLLVLLVLVLQLLAPHLSRRLLHSVITAEHARRAPLAQRSPPLLRDPAERVCPKPGTSFEDTDKTAYHCRQHTMSLAEHAQRVVAEFDFDQNAVQKSVDEFLREMDEGLQNEGTELSQIPTYVTAVPNGTEKGLYMAVDLGGTNFRVCSVNLHGNSTFTLTQSKTPIPHDLMVAKTSKELFSFLAKQIEAFLKEHHEDHYFSHIKRRNTGETQDQEIFSLGFTFSFPVNQVGINKGMLMRWTKGFDIHDTVGKDVCALLQKEIDALHLPVKVAALVNDTVGTLMARSYTSPGKSHALLGAIFGTGTNGAYVEKLSKVTKLVSSTAKAGTYDDSTGEMIINTEWGSFDNKLRTLPNTPYDTTLDKDSNNPGIQMFEKRISGMYLGELFRLAVVSLIHDPNTPFTSSETGPTGSESKTTTRIPATSPVFKQWGIDTSFLSLCASDTSASLNLIRESLASDLQIPDVSPEDARALQAIAGAVVRRAARLSAVAIGAIVLNSGRLDEGEQDVDIGVDGSLVEFYPDFEGLVREALRGVKGIGEREKRVRIGIAKDGSGVGAALIALVAAGRAE